MTAFAMEGDKERCLEAGMDDYISKPIMIEDIQKMLTKWVVKVQPEDKQSRKMIFSPGELLDQNAVNRLKDLAEKVDPGFLQQVLHMFFEQAPQLIKEIKEYEKRGEARKLSQSAHKLKGSGLNLGANALVEICKEIEIKGNNEELSNMENLIVTLENVYRQTERQLQKVMLRP
jgi:HPt (histidine-containing phosphotransfer) domain-containing protein